MTPRLTLTLATALMAWLPTHANTLQKITDSKTVIMGVRDSGAPLSYTLGNGVYVGYHVELCEKIISGIRRQLKLTELDIKYIPVTSTNRLPLVQTAPST